MAQKRRYRGVRKAALIILAALCWLSATGQEVKVDPDSSVIQFPGSRVGIERFASKLKACRKSSSSIVNIWHIGGSHVQAGWFTSRMRHNFDSLGHYPAGGRAYIFPYPLARTNYDKSYKSGYTGEWTGSMSSNPNRSMPVQPGFGVCGIAAYTSDTTASFGVRIPGFFSRIHIMGSGSSEDVLPYITADDYTVRCRRDTLLSGFVADLPFETDTVLVEPRLKDGEHFVVTGILPEDNGCGVRYVSTGVNGARTNTWTSRCPEFEREASQIHPDLVILALGINDSACPPEQFNPERFKANYRKLLDIILSQAPDCAVLFITNNDSWRWSRRRMVHNDNGSAVRKAMFELASEYDAGVWDLFSLMGGNGSADAWRGAGLMKNDRLHFTREGYELLGDLLYTALMRECETR